jgi:hypothetical protein
MHDDFVGAILVIAPDRGEYKIRPYENNQQPLD